MNRRNGSRGKRRGGFTLIEVMLVIGILVMLGTVAVIGYTQIRKGANINTAQAMVNETAHAVELYYNAMSNYPADDGLAALYTVPSDEAEKTKWVNGGGPFLKNSETPNDPWGNALQYEKVEGAEVGGVGFHVWSNGPDGQSGTDDDIRSWKVAN